MKVLINLEIFQKTLKSLKTISANHDSKIYKELYLYIQSNTEHSMKFTLVAQGSGTNEFDRVDVVIDDVENDGCVKVGIDFEMLYTFVTKIKKKGNDIGFSFSSDCVYVSSGKSRAKFIPALDMLPLSMHGQYEEQKVFKANTKDLIESLQYANMFAPKKDLRFYMNGVYLDVFENSCNVVATDGHRLLKKGLKIDHIHNDFVGGIVIRKPAVSPIINILKSMSCEDVTVKVTPDTVKFDDGDLSIETALLSLGDSKYPDYNRILNGNSTDANPVTCSMGDLKESVEFLSSIKSEGTLLTKEGDSLVLSAKPKGKTTTTFYNTIDCQSLLRHFECGINTGYLKDVLKCIKEDEIDIGINNTMFSFYIEENDLAIVVMMLRMKV